MIVIFIGLQQDRLRLTRLKTELSESVQRYGDLQKVQMDTPLTHSLTYREIFSSLLLYTLYYSI